MQERTIDPELRSAIEKKKAEMRRDIYLTSPADERWFWASFLGMKPEEVSGLEAKALEIDKARMPKNVMLGIQQFMC